MHVLVQVVGPRLYMQVWDPVMTCMDLVYIMCLTHSCDCMLYAMDGTRTLADVQAQYMTACDVSSPVTGAQWRTCTR